MKTIRSLRQARGWTQFELALKAGVQPQSVYFWESGRRTPQVPQLRKLGELFGMCSDEISLESIVRSNQSLGRPGGGEGEPSNPRGDGTQPT